MAGVAATEQAEIPHRKGAPRGLSAWLVRFARGQPLGFVGGIAILVMVFVALFAPIVAPYDPLESSFLDQLKPPSREHLLGTDPFGRDVLSRLIYGSRTALLVGF